MAARHAPVRGRPGTLTVKGDENAGTVHRGLPGLDAVALPGRELTRCHVTPSREEVNEKMTSKGNGNSRGGSFANGASNSLGPAIAGNMNWELRELMASQSNQFRDGQ